MTIDFESAKITKALTARTFLVNSLYIVRSHGQACNYDFGSHGESTVGGLRQYLEQFLSEYWVQTRSFVDSWNP